MELGKRKMAMSFRLKPNSLTRNFFLDTKRTLDQEPFANEVDTRMGFALGSDVVLQKRVKDLLSKGLTREQVAKELGYSLSTVKRTMKEVGLNLPEEKKKKFFKAYEDFVKENNRPPSRAEWARAAGMDVKMVDLNKGDFVLSEGREESSKIATQAAKEKAMAQEATYPKRYKYENDFGIKWPKEQMIEGELLTTDQIKQSWMNDLAKRLEYPKGGNEYKAAQKEGKFLTDKQLSIKYGSPIDDVIAVNSLLRKEMDITVPLTAQGAKERRRNELLRSSQGYTGISGDVKTGNQVHHIFPYAGYEPVKTGDLMILNKYLNGLTGPEYKELNRIADEIVKIDPLEFITDKAGAEAKLKALNEESKKNWILARDKMPSNLKNAVGYIEYYPVYDENGTVFAMRGKKIGADPNLSLQYLTDNVSKNIKNFKQDEIKNFRESVKQEAGTNPLRKPVLSTDALGAIGCPNSFMSGGRVKFSTGDSCVRKGLQAIESGKLDKAQLNAYENILQKSGKLTDQATQLFKAAKKAGSATGKLFEGLISVGTGITGAVGGVGFEVGMGYDQLARGDVRGFFRDSILGIIPGTFKSRREEMLDITRSEEETVALTNLYDYQDKYNQAVELENRIYARENDPLEGLIEGAEPFDVLAAQKELAQIDSELAEMYPKVQNEQVQNLVDTVSDRLTLEKTKKFDGLYGTVMGRGSLERDLPNILAEEKQKAYQEDPETIYQKQQQAPGMAPVIIDPDTLDLNFSRGMFANGSHSNPEIQKILDLIPQLMIADFVPISEKVELKRLFDQFNDRYMRKAEGGRIGFNKGGFDPTKRSFLKLITALAALPVVGKYIKLAKPVTKVIPKIDIVQTPGMPTFYSKMVNDALNYGVDKTKELGTLEREVVKQHKFGEYDVTVSHQLDTGDVSVEVNGPGTLFDEPVQMNYRSPKKTETGETIPADFKTNEAAVRGSRTGPDDYEITAEDDFIVEDTNKLGSDLTKLEEAVTGKDVSKRKKIVREDRQKYYESRQGQEQVLEEKYGYFDDTQPEDLIDE